jgi:lysophospholipase L1-like esterase
MLRYLALGDSYTIGEAVSEAERWPVQLAGLLRGCGIDIEEPQIVARTGWTTDELAAGIRAKRPRGPFNLVSLLIGVNNQYRGRPLEEYRTEFRGLLGRAIDLAGGDASRVLALSIPDWGVTPFAQGRDGGAIGREIDSFNAVAREEAAAAGAAWVDVTASSRVAEIDRSLVAGDGLHPSGAMYARWAQLALPAALVAVGHR